MLFRSHRGRSVIPMRVHRLIEHVPVGSNRLQALFLSDDLALTASDFELPLTSDIAEVLGKMPGATLLARDLDHDLGGISDRKRVVCGTRLSVSIDSGWRSPL